MRLIALLAFILLFGYNAALTSAKEQISEAVNEGHLKTMRIFYEQISPLDSAKGIVELDALLEQSKSEKKKKHIAIALGLKGIFIYQKDDSNLDTAIHFLKLAKQLSEQHHLQEWDAIFTNYLGFLLFLNKEYQEGVEQLLFSDHLLNNLGYENFYEAEIYLYHLARVYFEFNKYNKSIEYLEKVLELAPPYSKTRQLALNLMGITHAELSENEKAAHYLEMTKEDLVKKGNLPGIAALNGNLGILYSFQKKYDKAIPLLKAAHELNLQNERWRGAASTILWLTKIAVQEDELSLAKGLLDSALFFIYEKDVQALDILKLYFETSSAYHEKSGNYKIAYSHLDSLHIIEDSTLKLKDASMLSDLSMKLITDKHYFELELLEKEKKHQAFIRNVIIVLAFLISLLLLYLWFYSSKKRKKEKELFQKEQKRIRAELNDFRKRIKSKNKLLEDFKAQLNEIQNESKELEKTKSKMVKELSQSIILTEDDWVEFKKLFENVYPDFLNKVQTEFPDLTTSEIRFLALLKINLSVSEMANILAILPESVRKTRQRLMKKLEISYHKELRTFIRDI